MSDLSTIASLATAGGTLVLAIATFSSIRSSNRYARLAERSLLASQRPVIIPSREDDLVERVRFGDGHLLEVHGHGCAFERHDDALYLAIGIRNGGEGLAVLRGWRVEARENRPGDARPDVEEFRRQQRDLFIPSNYAGFWQGAIRDPEDPAYEGLRRAEADGSRVIVDLLYGDAEGGQRTIARFSIASAAAEEGVALRADVVRYWNLDRADPR